MKTIALCNIKGFSKILVVTFLIMNLNQVKSQSGYPLIKDVNNSYWATSLYEFTNNYIGTAFGIGFDPNNQEFPNAKFHIKIKGELTSRPAIQVESASSQIQETAAGSVKLLFNDNVFNDLNMNFGIYQVGHSFYNCLEGSLIFNSMGSSSGIAIYKSSNDPFYFMVHGGGPEAPDFFPLELYHDKLKVNDLLECNDFLLHNNAGTGRILVSDQDGNGIWTDPSSFGGLWQLNHDNIISNQNYQNVGVWTNAPEDKFQINDGINKIAFGSADGVGSPDFNGSSYIGFNASRQMTDGKWTLSSNGDNSGAGIILSDVSGNMHFSTLASNNSGGGIRTPEGEGDPLPTEGITDQLVAASIKMTITNTGNVGIGTLLPLTKLDINGNLRVSNLATTSSSKMIVPNAQGILTLSDIPPGDNLGDHTASQNINLNGFYLSGNGQDNGLSINNIGHVGIGTKVPLALFDIVSEGESNLFVRNNNDFNSSLWVKNIKNSYGLGVDFQGYGYLYSNEESPEKIMYFENGRVGIGASPKNSSHRLYVAGGITTEEVKVRIQGQWSDNVFDTNFCLQPLSQLKSYIETNRHLPDVPTKKDVEKEGIEVGQMNAVLLKKIEELTLYVIQLKEEIIELQKNKNINK